MNNSFRGAFNYGFKNFSGYNKSFFNSKFNMNFMNSSSNKSQAFKINMSNKCFMSKTLYMSQSHSILNEISNLNSFSGLTSSFKEINSEVSVNGADCADSLVLIGELCFLRDDCKWTCGTRLTSGPRSPMMEAAKNGWENKL